MPHLVSHHRQHGDLDLVSDHDALVRLARQDEHGVPSPGRQQLRIIYVLRGANASVASGTGEDFALVSRRRWPRKSLRPHLNQIRTWTRQGRTDAWVAHQLEVTVQQIASFKRESGLLDEEPGADGAGRRARRRASTCAPRTTRGSPPSSRRPSRRAWRPEEAAEARAARRGGREAAAEEEDDAEAPPAAHAPRSRRGRAAGRRRSREPSTTARRATGCGSTRRSSTTRSTPSTGPDTGPVTVTIEEDQIVIRRSE